MLGRSCFSATILQGSLTHCTAIHVDPMPDPLRRWLAGSMAVAGMRAMAPEDSSWAMKGALASHGR